ncbi:MAG TPA: hypothetical protein VGJ15_08350 [Pirellulales bacterium]|jgi:hypothetical protein
MKYLLPCPACGTKIPVETGQAGQTISCKCGHAIEVPTIRGLQKLEAVAERDESEQRPWSARKGLIFLGSIIFLAAAAWAGYLIADRPGLIEIDSLAKLIDHQTISQEVDALSPSDCYARLSAIAFASPTTFADQLKTNPPVHLLPSTNILLALEDDSMKRLAHNSAEMLAQNVMKQVIGDNERQQQRANMNDALWVAGALGIVGILLAGSALLLGGKSPARRRRRRPMEVR